MRLEESEFYLFEAPASTRCLFTDAPGVIREREEIHCPLNAGHARIGRFLSELDVVVPCAPPANVLFSWGAECLIGEVVLTALERAQLTGFRTRPARARMKKTGEPVPVRQLLITGWGGVAPAESGIRLEERCPACRHSHYSPLTAPQHLIDPQNWDGSDFFIIWPLPAFILVTKRVRQVFEDNGFKGVRFLKAFPKGSGSGYGPLPLRYTFPEGRAHEIGDPLGIY